VRKERVGIRGIANPEDKCILALESPTCGSGIGISLLQASGILIVEKSTKKFDFR
jgi:hypothetical protein